MTSSHEAPSSADVASTVTDLSVGLGILTYTFFPFALPLILLVVVPLVLVALAGVLVAIPFVIAVRLARGIARRWSQRRAADVSPAHCGRHEVAITSN